MVLALEGRVFKRRKLQKIPESLQKLLKILSERFWSTRLPHKHAVLRLVLKQGMISPAPGSELERIFAEKTRTILYQPERISFSTVAIRDRQERIINKL